MQADEDDSQSGYQYPPRPVPVDHQDESNSDGDDNAEEAGPPSYAYPPIPRPVGAYEDAITDAVDTIVKQPSAAHSKNTPPGLGVLNDLNQLFIKQDIELLEAFFGCETKNKYKVKNNEGKIIFIAKEETDCCTRNCCGSLRPFELSIKNEEEREVIHLSRPFACNTCLCPCLLQSIVVQSPPGTVVGSVVQDWSLWIPQFRILDASGETKLRIKGPCCTFSICGSVEFKILSKDGSEEVGKISKQWGGLLREGFTDADNFGISFPSDLDVRMKAVVLGALFLIDLMYFED